MTVDFIIWKAQNPVKVLKKSGFLRMERGFSLNREK